MALDTVEILSGRKMSLLWKGQINHWLTFIPWVGDIHSTR